MHGLPLDIFRIFVRNVIPIDQYSYLFSHIRSPYPLILKQTEKRSPARRTPPPYDSIIFQHFQIVNLSLFLPYLLFLFIFFLLNSPEYDIHENYNQQNYLPWIPKKPILIPSHSHVPKMSSKVLSSSLLSVNHQSFFCILAFIEPVLMPVRILILPPFIR